jgi:hypothetical protein
MFSRWRTVDLNGDGREDWFYWRWNFPALYLKTLIHQADGTRALVRHDVSLPPSSITPGTYELQTVDVGGPSGASDGIADLVIIDDAKRAVVTMLGQGNGTFALPVVTPYSLPVNAVVRGHVLDGAGDTNNWRAMDVNGDGRADLVHTAIRQPASGTATLRIDTLLATGNGGWLAGASGDAGLHRKSHQLINA